MKNFVLILLTAVILVSCKSKPANHQTDSLTAVTPAMDSIKKIKNLVKGSWVTRDYVDDLVKTKSVIESRQYFAGNIALIINDDNKASDSLIVSCRTSMHEGGDTPFAFYYDTKAKMARTKPDEKTGFHELTYQISRKDTSLIIYYHDVKNHITRPQFYIKALGSNVNNLHDADPVQTITNRKLFTGKYTLIDTANKRITIKFTDDGVVIGHPELKFYDVMTDFTFADSETEANNLDEILFNWYDKKLKQSKYIYTINRDTIKLFDDTVTTGKLVPGKLVYQLVGKK